MKAAAYIRVSGLVQGVNFRYFTQQTARDLGLSGWVRNRPDGDVDLEAEGERGLIEELLKALRVGPPAAHVRDVQVQWQEKSGNDYDGFEVTFWR
jgi:acylphosphatase